MLVSIQYQNICEVTYLVGNDLVLAGNPKVVSHFQSLHVSITPNHQSLTETLETHLEGWNLNRFSEIGLEAGGDIFPAEQLIVLEAKQEGVFLVDVDRTRWGGRHREPALFVVCISFVVNAERSLAILCVPHANFGGDVCIEASWWRGRNCIT